MADIGYMSLHRRHDASKEEKNLGKEEPDRATARPAGSSPVPRVRSRELLRDGTQLIIEHAGREYRLRVTGSGKLILTA